MTAKEAIGRRKRRRWKPVQQAIDRLEAARKSGRHDKSARRQFIRAAIAFHRLDLTPLAQVNF